MEHYSKINGMLDSLKDCLKEVGLPPASVLGIWIWAHEKGESLAKQGQPS